VSPGLVKEQESYLLGSVFDPQLTRALMSMFIDPDHTLDAEFTAAAGSTLLAFVNGARQGQAQAVVPVVPGSSPEDGRMLLRHGKWRLPAVGQAPEQDTLLSGVRRAVVYKQVRRADRMAGSAALESACWAESCTVVFLAGSTQSTVCVSSVTVAIIPDLAHAATAEQHHLLAPGVLCLRADWCCI
jgi:hypothetical protein